MHSFDVQAGFKNKLYNEKSQYDSNLNWVFRILSVVLVGVRILSSFFNTVNDCDETYNYWEPMHYQLFGTGFQTWEYSPTYSLRSYYYIGLHAIPLWLIMQLFHPSRLTLFYLLRLILGTFCAFCEITFCRAIYKKVSREIGILTMFFLMFSTGMFISSTAYLPSSSAMYFVMLAYSFWLNLNFKMAVFMIASATLIGWPFAAVLGIAVAVDMLWRRLYASFIKYSLVSAVLILLPMMAVDYYYYRIITISPLNLVKYNIFSSKGPELYGVEPFSYYIYNGILNFNVVFPFGLVSILVLFVSFKCGCYYQRDVWKFFSLLFPLYLWMGIFLNQAHKEERFLFPIYPLLCMSAAMCIHGIVSIIDLKMSKIRTSKITTIMKLLLLSTFVTLSLSRTFLLIIGFSAPLKVYSSLEDFRGHVSAKEVNVCVAKEWHRFPSSFFMPSDNWHLRFVKSDFKGQLPQLYGGGPDGTYRIPPDMNDDNREELSRYFDVGKCHFLVDLDVERESALEPRYATHQNWSQVISYPFLDHVMSPRWARSFYLPKLTASRCSFRPYNLLVNKLLVSLNRSWKMM